jgi:uncharacterized protein (TIGR01244 family)
MTRSERPVFLPSVLLGALGASLALLVWFGLLDHPKDRTFRQLSAGVYVTEQVGPQDLPDLADRFAVVVDLRPDGEAQDQASSAEIGDAARALGLAFFYVPVPHEAIPPDAVTRLGDALDETTGDALLYCRSGKRATRTFALVQASDPDGPTADEILGMVRDAGYSAEDLRAEIAARIAKRPLAP